MVQMFFVVVIGDDNVGHGGGIEDSVGKCDMIQNRGDSHLSIHWHAVEIILIVG